MKDLIAKLQMDANCAIGAIWLHIDAQAARIAELESQIAAKPADTDKLREVLKLAVRQNSCDMLMTGEEIRKCEAALNSTALQAPVREVPEPEGWREAMQEFVDRCERGEILSRYTYSKFKALLAPLPAAPVQQEG